MSVSILAVVIMAPVFVIGLLNTKHDKKYLPNDFVANADAPAPDPDPTPPPPGDSGGCCEAGGGCGCN